MFYLKFDFNSDDIFVFPRVELHNKILISSQNSDLEKSASSTARPKLQRPWGRRGMDLQTGNSTCDLRVGPYSYGIAKKAEIQHLDFEDPPSTYITVHSVYYTLHKCIV